jgi:tetrapyrrole methylase family protein/MazG family protein
MKDPCEAVKEAGGGLERTLRLVECLLGENGCPWDRKQTPGSLTVYLIEEVFELVDAIESGDADAVCEELGDVLFQLVFVARLFAQDGHFTIDEVIRRNTEKMIRRHPHVFSDAQVSTAEGVRQRWGEIKKAEKGDGKATASVLDSVPAKLPALLRAYRLSERASGTGFDWDDLKGVMDKVGEEWTEFSAAVSGAPADDGAAEMELGDLLFTLVNVARLARIHPEKSLSRAARKFERRFREMEKMAIDSGRSIDEVPRQEKEQLWEEAKRRLGGD